MKKRWEKILESTTDAFIDALADELTDIASQFDKEIVLSSISEEKEKLNEWIDAAKELTSMGFFTLSGGIEYLATLNSFLAEDNTEVNRWFYLQHDFGKDMEEMLALIPSEHGDVVIIDDLITTFSDIDELLLWNSKIEEQALDSFRELKNIYDLIEDLTFEEKESYEYIVESSFENFISTLEFAKDDLCSIEKYIHGIL